MKEIFKDIPDYEGFYQVSNLGKVKSLWRKVKCSQGFKVNKEKVLKPYLNKKTGYLSVNLSKKGVRKTKTIHVLMAIVFKNHKPNGHKFVVDHIDNIKTNNFEWNIQVVTHRKNLSKDKKGCSSKYTGVHFHKIAKNWQANITINNKIKHIGSFKNEKEAAEAYQKELKIIEKQ